MGKLKSYLSQVQDFLTNRESRNIVLNDLDAELREQNLNDKKEPATEAIVLRVFPNNQTTDEIKGGKEQYYSAALRIPGDHDAISDPTSFDDADLINRAIDCHGEYYSISPFSSTTSEVDPIAPPKVGDIVKIEYINGVARFGTKTGIDKETRQSQSTSGAQAIFKATSPRELAGDVGISVASESLKAAKANTLLTGKKIQNGKLGDDLLETIPNIKDRSKRPVKVLKEVADEFKQLLIAFEKHFGYPLPLTDSYRTLARQKGLSESSPDVAAATGTSPHGWGLAFDYNTVVKQKDGSYLRSFDSPRYAWLFVNAPKYGFWNPAWAQRGGSMEEAWHFEVIDRRKYLKIFNAEDIVQHEPETETE